jgi:hypothetical protein
LCGRLTAPDGEVVTAAVAETGSEVKWLPTVERTQLQDRLLGRDPLRLAQDTEADGAGHDGRRRGVRVGQMAIPGGTRPRGQGEMERAVVLHRRSFLAGTET